MCYLNIVFLWVQQDFHAKVIQNLFQFLFFYWFRWFPKSFWMSTEYFFVETRPSHPEWIAKQQTFMFSHWPEMEIASVGGGGNNRNWTKCHSVVNIKSRIVHAYGREPFPEATTFPLKSPEQIESTWKMPNQHGRLTPQTEPPQDERRAPRSCVPTEKKVYKSDADCYRVASSYWHSLLLLARWYWNAWGAGPVEEVSRRSNKSNNLLKCLPTFYALQK